MNRLGPVARTGPRWVEPLGVGSARGDGSRELDGALRSLPQHAPGQISGCAGEDAGSTHDDVGQGEPSRKGGRAFAGSYAKWIAGGLIQVDRTSRHGDGAQVTGATTSSGEDDRLRRVTVGNRVSSS